MKKLVYFLIGSAFLVSCEKSPDENYVISNETLQKKANLRTTNQVKEDLRDEFVRILAIAIQDENLRLFIKQKAVQKYSGDYDFPYALVKDDIVTGKETLAEILLKYTDVQHTRNFGNNFFSQAIVEGDPYLSILVPVLSTVNPENWDTKQIPEVVSYTNEKGVEFQGFGVNGKTKLYKREIEPNQMTIVCKNSEGLIGLDINSYETILGNTLEKAITGKVEKDDALRDKLRKIVDKSDIKMKFQKNNKEITFVKLNDIFPESIKKTNDNKKLRASKTASCRDDFPNQKDYVYDYTVTEGGWDIAHDWFEGSNIEMCLYIYLASYPNSNPSFSSLLKRDAGRSHSNYINGPIYLDWEVLDWDKTTFGQLMKYKWFDSDESEWSGTITGNSTYKNDSLGITVGVSGTLSYSPKNDEMGESFVEFCDSPYPWSYSFYDTGLVYFRVSVHY